MRIARHAIMCVLGGEAIGVFVHVLRADGDCTGPPQAGDQCRVCLGGQIFSIDLGSGERNKTRNVVKIFDAKWNARERPRRFARGNACVEHPCFFKCRFTVERGKAVEDRIPRRDHVLSRGDNRLRTEMARAHAGGNRPRPGGDVAHARKTGAGSVSGGSSNSITNFA